jgi:parallel beta-helix repeat protein
MKRKYLTIGIIFLFVGACIIPATAQDNVKTSLVTSKENWLYVGGSGPGNYTRIQDAIDNATQGDIVFVYDDSSPYYENIVINTSLTLWGEDRVTTIINGSLGDPDTNYSIGVTINADDVTVQGFTIKGCNIGGIEVMASACHIIANIISDNFYGIGMGTANETLTEGSNSIVNNLFLHNEVGIYVSNGRDNSITGNVLSQNNIGIMISLSVNTNISHNVISEGDRGATIFGTYNTMLYRNNISYNENVGVTTVFTSADKILQNNFIGNNKSAESDQLLLLKIQLFKKELNLPLRRDVWNGNYWDEPRSVPYKIPGLGLFLKFRFQVDWHPAQAPYDITG